MSLDLTIGIVGILLAAATYFVGRVSAGKKDGKADGIVHAMLGSLQAGVNDIKQEQREQAKEQGKTNIEIITRLATVEASAKQAHKRIDEELGRKYPGNEGTR